MTRDSAGRWQIVDAAGSEIVVVETLTGHDDRLDQALALACDYAVQQQDYRDGRRESDPFPRISDTPRELNESLPNEVGALGWRASA